MGEVDLREKTQILKGDKLLQERRDTNDFSFGGAQEGEVVTIKAAKENSHSSNEFFKLSVG